MAKGACNCGTVQFEIDSELNDVYVCHCSICRRFTGSNGIAVVVVPNEKFRWLHEVDTARGRLGSVGLQRVRLGGAGRKRSEDDLRAGWVDHRGRRGAQGCPPPVRRVQGRLGRDRRPGSAARRRHPELTRRGSCAAIATRAVTAVPRIAGNPYAAPGNVRHDADPRPTPPESHGFTYFRQRDASCATCPLVVPVVGRVAAAHADDGRDARGRGLLPRME
jgi:hypothetical protein